MTHIHKADLLNKLEEADKDSIRVLDAESMTVGLKKYREDTAEEKGSRTHTRDELYFILTGAGKITIGENTYAVGPGDLLYVEAGMSHNIVEVDTQITVLKAFANNESSR